MKPQLARTIPLWSLAFLLVMLLPSASMAQLQPYQAEPGTITKSVGFDQRLGEKIPLDVTLRDETGREVMLAEYFGDRPVIFTLVYFRCPMICGQVLQGLARSIKPISMTPGSGYDIITISIDPTEGPELAAKKKAAYIEDYGRPEAAAGWHFLTTPDEKTIDRLASAIGFRYTYNPETTQYAHAAGYALLTPDGTISQYFFGIEIPSRNLQQSLEAAGASKVGSRIKQLLLFCYDFDPSTGKYSLTAMSILRTFAALTLAGIGILIVILLIRERFGRSARRESRNEPSVILDPRNT